jgi:hypothetical protein
LKNKTIPPLFAGMKILIEINEEAGAALEELAQKEKRSKTAQATKIVEDAVLNNQPEDAKA